ETIAPHGVTWTVDELQARLPTLVRSATCRISTPRGSRSPMSTSRFVLSCFLALGFSASAHAADSCRAHASALPDAKAIAGVRGAIARQCPCDTFDGSSKEKRHGAFVKCANGVIAVAVGGTPLLDAFTLRRQCRNEVKRIYASAACGFAEP